MVLNLDFGLATHKFHLSLSICLENVCLTNLLHNVSNEEELHPALYMAPCIVSLSINWPTTSKYVNSHHTVNLGSVCIF